MQLHTIADLTTLQIKVADHICTAVARHADAHQPFNLGLATGATPKGIYEILIPRLAKIKDLSGLSTFNLDEYLGLMPNHPNSYCVEMSHQFWQPLKKLNTTFSFQHAHIPDTATRDAAHECSYYESKIQKAGGIDLQILGIGTNGHIAFNEPGSAGGSRTRIVQIDEETRRVNADKFFAGDISRVPTQAITMGIGTILEAKKIILIALGESKRDIIQRFLHLKKPTTELPASFLLQHKNTVIYTDIANM